MTNWQPLLAGDEADVARRLARALADRIRQRPPVDYPGPAHGASGNALLFAELAKVFPDSDYDELASAELSRAIDIIAKQKLDPSLFSGFAGVAWSMITLDPRAGEQIDFSEVDRAVQSAIAGRYDSWAFDLVTGLSGFGVYLLARLPDPGASSMLHTLIGALRERSVATPTGRRFLTLPTGASHMFAKDNPRGWYDLGMGHGSAGVLAFLAAVHDALPNTDASALMREIASEIVAARQDPLVGSAFPYVIGLEASHTSHKSRLAWCYGDLGVAWSLWAAGRGQDERLMKLAVDVGRAAAARPFADTGVSDPGICHGAGGLSHLFMRLAQESRDPDLRRAAAWWSRKTIEMVGDPNDLHATAWQVQGETFVDTSVLTGAVGVALALLSASADIEPVWDGFLGLFGGAHACACRPTHQMAPLSWANRLR